MNTGSNLADFRLVSDTGGTVGGNQSSLGSASPTGTANPLQHNPTLLWTLFDSGTGVINPTASTSTILVGGSFRTGRTSASTHRSPANPAAA